MWVFLDDIRPCPNGWTPARTYDEAIELLKSGRVVGMSFDHDLGLVTEFGEKTGYDVLKWIEEQVIMHDFCPPIEMTIHSANPVGHQNMRRAIESIRRYTQDTAAL
jgi:hypothetical protein